MFSHANITIVSRPDMQTVSWWPVAVVVVVVIVVDGGDGAEIV